MFIKNTQNSWSYACAAGITDTADYTLKAAATGSLKNYITNIQIINKSATGTDVVIKNGSTVIWRFYAPQNAVIEAGFDVPLCSSVGSALNFACITTASNTYINAQGYQER